MNIHCMWSAVTSLVSVGMQWSKPGSQVCQRVCVWEGGVHCMVSHFTGQCGNALAKARQSSLSACVCVCVGGGSLHGQSLHWSVWECTGQSQAVKSVSVCVWEGVVHCMVSHFTGQWRKPRSQVSGGWGASCSQHGWSLHWSVWECTGQSQAVKSVSVCVWEGVVHCMVSHFTGQCGNAVAKTAQSSQWRLGGFLFTAWLVTSLVSVGMRWPKPGNEVKTYGQSQEMKSKQSVVRGFIVHWSFHWSVGE